MCPPIHTVYHCPGNLETVLPAPSAVMTMRVNMAWDREDSLFMVVDSVDLEQAFIDSVHGINLTLGKKQK
jgi:hypothetical protein